MTDELTDRYRHETSLDRAGLAVAVGGMMGGGVSAGLTAIGTPSGTWGLIGAFILGSILSALAITAVAAPVWIFMHLSGRRGAGNAARVGAVTGFVIFVFGQTYGFGLFDAPPSDIQTLLFRWASAIATSLILAAIAAVIGVIMWRVAYRTVR